MKDKNTLLIVDDDIAHRTMLRILLDWQYEIIEADDGSTAIEIAGKRNVDLILMDIRMAEVSGIEALDRIKTLRPDLPVVMMTAYYSVEIAAQVRERGAFDCLSKPFDFDEMRQIIKHAMVSSRPQQTLML